MEDIFLARAGFLCWFTLTPPAPSSRPSRPLRFTPRISPRYFRDAGSRNTPIFAPHRGSGLCIAHPGTSPLLPSSLDAFSTLPGD
jgi:hypothetical protein